MQVDSIPGITLCAVSKVFNMNWGLQHSKIHPIDLIGSLWFTGSQNAEFDLFWGGVRHDKSKLWQKISNFHLVQADAPNHFPSEISDYLISLRIMEFHGISGFLVWLFWDQKHPIVQGFNYSQAPYWCHYSLHIHLIKWTTQKRLSLYQVPRNNMKYWLINGTVSTSGWICNTLVECLSP